MVLYNTTNIYIELDKPLQYSNKTKVATMTTKYVAAILATTMMYGTISRAEAAEPSLHGVVEALAGYSTPNGVSGTADAIGKLTVDDHLMFFARYRGTADWQQDNGLTTSEFSVQNIRFPNLVGGVGVVLERQHAGNWTDYRIGVQHAWNNDDISTYVLATAGETFAEGIAVVRYNREISDLTFFAQVEGVVDVSYKGDFLFATERPRVGIQKGSYSLALAADMVQQKGENQATMGLAGAVGF